MKNRSITLIAALMACGGASAQDLTPNTQQLNVAGFYQLNAQTGDYERYQAVGFHEPAVGSTPARVYLMPQIFVKPNGLSFIGRDGATIKREDDAGPDNVGKVRVSLGYHGGLPTPDQRVGVLAQIFGSGETSSVPAMKVASLSQPPFMFMPPHLRGQFDDFMRSREEERKRQSELLAKWPKIQPQVVAINGVTITLLVDGEPVASRVLPATLLSSGALPDLFVSDPDEATINRLKERAFQVQVDYTFLHARIGSINANFKFDEAMRRLVTESRKTRAKSKSSGVQFLGFGNRKQSLSQYMKETSKEQINQDRLGNTVIEMRDADEGLIAMFESKFFPQLSKSEVITSHIEAGKLAESQGKKDLAAAHFGYAKAVSEDKLNLDVDTNAALASLAAGDYFGFVAKGVKIQSNQGTSASHYARVMTQEADVKQEIQWSAVRTTSTQRKVSQIVEVAVNDRKPSLGVCYASLLPIARPMPMVPPGYPLPPPPPPAPVLYPVCLDAGGPLDRAGFAPGDGIVAIDGEVVSPTTSATHIASLLADRKPGDVIEVRKFNGFMPNGRVAYTPVNVKLGQSKEPR